jgi:mannitol 2-dehydrogenase
MADPLIHALFRKVQTEEIIPHVKPLSGSPVMEYLDLIDRRFSNDAIIDTVRRVAFDGSARHAGFILPSIRDGLATGKSVEGLALVEAAWARMCEGTRENGSRIEANDPVWDMLTATAMAARETPAVWLDMQQIYGDLATQERFAMAFEKWLVSMYRNGVEATIRQYLGQD